MSQGPSFVVPDGDEGEYISSEVILLYNKLAITLAIIIFLAVIIHI